MSMNIVRSGTSAEMTETYCTYMNLVSTPPKNAAKQNFDKFYDWHLNVILNKNKSFEMFSSSEKERNY